MKSPHLPQNFHPSLDLAVDTSIGVAVAIGSELRGQGDDFLGMLADPQGRNEAIRKIGLRDHAFMLTQRASQKLVTLGDPKDFSPRAETYFHYLFSLFDFKDFDPERFRHLRFHDPKNLAGSWLSAATSQPAIRQYLPIDPDPMRDGRHPIFDLDTPSAQNTAARMALTVVEEVFGDPVVFDLAFPRSKQPSYLPQRTAQDEGGNVAVGPPSDEVVIGTSSDCAGPSDVAPPGPPEEPPAEASSAPSPGDPSPEQRLLVADLQDPKGEGLARGNLLLLTCSVLLAPSTTHDAQAKIETDPEIPHITLVLSTTGFTCSTVDAITIDLPPGKDSKAVPFNLISNAASGHSITIAAFQDGVFKGELLIRDIDQILAKAKAGSAPILLISNGADAGNGLRVSLREPDLIADLTVMLDSYDSDIRISSPRTVLSMDGENIGPLKSEAKTVLKSVRDKVGKLYRGDVTLSDVKRELDILGSQISRILPDELRKHLADPKIKLVYFKIGVDADLPIELCLLSQDGRPDIRLSDKCAIVRWYRESKAASNCGQFEVSSMAFIAGRLVHGFDGEQDAVLSSYPMAAPFRAGTLDDVRKKIFSQDLHDVIHFKGHIENGDDKETAISIESGEQLRLCEIGVLSDERAVFKREPIVFLNGCDAVISSQLIGGKSSFPYRFCDLNATAFVGTLWEVDERPASVFTRIFYSELRGKKSAAEALRNARLEVMRIAEQDNTLTDRQRVTYYLASRAYVYFGPCDMHITFSERGKS